MTERRVQDVLDRRRPRRRGARRRSHPHLLTSRPPGMPTWWARDLQRLIKLRSRTRSHSPVPEPFVALTDAVASAHAKPGPSNGLAHAQQGVVVPCNRGAMMDHRQIITPKRARKILIDAPIVRSNR